ncbi:MAG: hypothetical protein Q9159_000668 [Coniocarpon cinnabarinum]
MESSAILKSIQYRLIHTPSEGLPAILPSLHHSLCDCKRFISGLNDAKSTSKTDHSSLQNVKKTLTSFLIDRKDSRRRWVAAVLIKDFANFGIRTILDDLNAWTRGLLSILSKWDDPPKTKEVAILTIAQVAITAPLQQVKEFVTPVLPGYIKACLQNVAFDAKAQVNESKRKTQTNLMPVIFKVFSELIEHHATVFRPFDKQIRDLLMPLLAHTPSSAQQSNKTIGYRDLLSAAQVSAQRLFIRLHYLAPKNSASQAWNDTLSSIIADTHATLDRIFRSVKEDQRYTDECVGDQRQQEQPIQESTAASRLGLPPWEGIFAGSERLIGLLSLVTETLTSRTAGQVSIPTVAIAKVLMRIMQVLIPDSKNGKLNQHLNHDYSPEERDSLWAVLPSIHVSALKTLQALCTALPFAVMPQAVMLLDRVAHVAQRESFSDPVQQAAFDVSARLLSICGRGLTKSQTRPVNNTVKLACEVLVPSRSGPHPAQNGIPHIPNQGRQSISITSEQQPITPLQDSAAQLLTAYLNYVQPSQTPISIRTLIDRTAILSANKATMLTSVINSPSTSAGTSGPVRSSILPFLARRYGRDVDVEGLVRPQLPVLVKEIDVTIGEDRADSLGSNKPRRPDGKNKLSQDDEAPEAFAMDEDEDADIDTSQAARKRLSTVFQSGDKNARSIFHTHFDALDSNLAHTRSPKRPRTQSPPLAEAPTNQTATRQNGDPVTDPITESVNQSLNDSINNPMVQPTDPIIPPAGPLPVPVITSPTEEGESNVIIEPASAVGPLHEGQPSSDKGDSEGVNTGIEREGKGDGEGDSDSDENMSLPELVFASEDEDEDEAGDDEEKRDGRESSGNTGERAGETLGL